MAKKQKPLDRMSKIELLKTAQRLLKQVTKLGEAARVCTEAYQVVGSMLTDLGQFETSRGQKIMDNLSNARMVHSDVLPWPSFNDDGLRNFNNLDDMLAHLNDEQQLVTQEQADAAAMRMLQNGAAKLSYVTDERQACETYGVTVQDHSLLPRNKMPWET